MSAGKQEDEAVSMFMCDDLDGAGVEPDPETGLTAAVVLEVRVTEFRQAVAQKPTVTASVSAALER